MTRLWLWGALFTVLVGTSACQVIQTDQMGMMTIEIDDSPFFTRPTSTGWHDYFIERLGKRRYGEALRRMNLTSKVKLKEIDLAKIVISARDVKRRDIQEVLEGYDPLYIDRELIDQCRGYKTVEDLDSELFHKIYTALSDPFQKKIHLKQKSDSIEEKIEQIYHVALSLFHFNPYWYAKERGDIFEETFALSKIQYYERLACFYAASEDLEVGCYIPAPSTDRPKYYRVRAQLVTGCGQIGHFLLPATKDMDLPPIRLTRGTPKTPSELDFYAHIVTDLESEIGKTGYESGLPYEEKIEEIFPNPYIELGYSIGGTIAQWRVAKNIDHVSELWLFKSPGVPKKVWEEFNQKVLEASVLKEVRIFQAKRDLIDLAGDHTLGYKAPSNIAIYLYEIVINKINVHRYHPTDAAASSITEIPKENIDRTLEHSAKERLEKGRKAFGSSIGVPFFRFIDRLMKRKHKSRADLQKGLRYENEKGDLTVFIAEQA